MSSPLYKGMNGGKKQLWLVQNRQQVLDYFRQHGFEATCLFYNMTSGTLESFLKRSHVDRSISQVDRAMMMAEIAITSNRELRGKIEDLLTQTRRFKEDVSLRITKLLITPAVNAVIKLPPELEFEEDNTLKIDNSYDDFEHE
jgi:hypothetical protein